MVVVPRSELVDELNVASCRLEIPITGSQCVCVCVCVCAWVGVGVHEGKVVIQRQWMDWCFSPHHSGGLSLNINSAASQALG